MTSDPNAYNPVTEDLTPGTGAAQTPPLAPSAVSEPLRPLSPGAFLAGELEIKQVLQRGPTNFYVADAGDWGQTDLKLVAERLLLAPLPEPPAGADLFPDGHRFTQDGREYAAWPMQELTPLEEWRPPANDETFLQIFLTLASGLAALEEAELDPDLCRDSCLDCLYLTSAGDLRYLGFFDAAAPSGGANALEILSGLIARITRRNIAPGATMRLDDEFGTMPFSEEVKGLARGLKLGQFPTVQAAAAALRDLPGALKTEVALLTDVGQERSLNEDSGLIFQWNRAGHLGNYAVELLAVADGMGGHEGGEVASDLTISALQNALVARSDLDWQDNVTVRTALRQMLEEVNAAVVEMNQNPPYAGLRHKPGSTLVCALRLGSRLFIGNVGDSRAYRWNVATGLTRLTRDHSYVQDLIDAGRLRPEEAWGHPDGAVITSHIGLPRGLLLDTYHHLLCRGDKIVLVSDGVVDMLKEAEIETLVSQSHEAQPLCARLIEAANAAGGADNITAAALFVTA